MELSVGSGQRRTRHAALGVAAVVGLLAGMVMAFAPPSSAASNAYAVTEVPVDFIVSNVAADPVTNTVYAAQGNGSAVAVIDGADTH
jgi:hypothetical protein